jgi:hypothetical protein
VLCAAAECLRAHLDAAAPALAQLDALTLDREPFGAMLSANGIDHVLLEGHLEVQLRAHQSALEELRTAAWVVVGSHGSAKLLRHQPRPR